MIRTKNTYETQIYEFVKDILVACPACSEKAVVKTSSEPIRNINENDIRLVCAKCGFNKRLDQIPKIDNDLISRTFIFASAIDPYFHQSLWLVQNCGEEILWAYNYEHLDFLERHVEAKLRERNIQTVKLNKSLGSRLPKWMTSKKNRETVLKTIKQLKEK